MQTSIADIRKDYKMASFTEKEASGNPFEQFTHWWNDALKSNIEDVNAMTLCTVTPTGKPTGRIVLLKGYDEAGFVFFTNYESNKGKQLAANPFASLVFYWKELERQVRIEGTVQKVTEEESDAYFNSRPEGSKIGAWASHQSAVIPYREIIEQNALKYAEIFDNQQVPRPPHWGGYKVQPTLFEFWQGRSSRLHDRLQYTLEKNIWKRERLAP